MRILLSLFVFTLFLTQGTWANDNWTFVQGDGVTPRGGTTKGPAVKHDTSISTAWKNLRAPGISKYERDRRAIYAMVGVFESRFEFIETIPMTTKKKRDRPYASWGTEFVQVIEDTGDFISLQHIMVMFFIDDSDQVVGPYVVKHWRQDWQWEGKSQLLYEGSRTWSMKNVALESSKGAWVWTVWQVDDSPRYSGIGRWNHFESTSIFETDYMSRPLPRREFSVRSDYKLLMGKDTILITPTAWYHEQKNFKHKENLLAHSFNGVFLGREVGHNSYKRIVGFDISSGQQYWNESKNYWRDVRATWKEIFTQKKSVTLKKHVDGTSLYIQHFSQAEDSKVLGMESADRKQLIRDTIEKYFEQ